MIQKQDIPEELTHGWIAGKLKCPVCTDTCWHVFHYSNFRNDEANVWCECNICNNFRMFDVLEIGENKQHFN